MLKSSSCDYSDAYILLNETIETTNTGIAKPQTIEEIYKLT